MFDFRYKAIVGQMNDLEELQRKVKVTAHHSDPLKCQDQSEQTHSLRQ